MNGSAASEPSLDPALQRRVEDFLYHEAELLDAWRLDDWLALLTADVAYEIPSTDADTGDLGRELGFVHDDRERVEARVDRLKSRHAHREFPWSRTRRLIANVRVRPDDAGQLGVEANFAIWRFRSDRSDTFVGRYEYRLVEDGDDGLLIAFKRAWLDLERLHPHGTVSILL